MEAMSHHFCQILLVRSKVQVIPHIHTRKKRLIQGHEALGLLWEFCLPYRPSNLSIQCLLVIRIWDIIGIDKQIMSKCKSIISSSKLALPLLLQRSVNMTQLPKPKTWRSSFTPYSFSQLHRQYEVELTPFFHLYFPCLCQAMVFFYLDNYSSL